MTAKANPVLDTLLKPQEFNMGETTHADPPTQGAENARSVRKNPKDSGLEKLGGQQVVERHNVSTDSGPR